MSNMFSLEGKIALVTGASYGIGFAIACAMSDAGATIVFNDIKQELVDKGIAAYAEKGIKAHGYVCDVTDEAAVNALVAKIEEEVGVIDILVNNAGIIKRIPMCEMTAEQFRQVIDVDLNAPFIVSKAVIPSMIKKGHGKIINICSMNHACLLNALHACRRAAQTVHTDVQEELCGFGIDFQHIHYYHVLGYFHFDYFLSCVVFRQSAVIPHPCSKISQEVGNASLCRFLQPTVTCQPNIL